MTLLSGPQWIGRIPVAIDVYILIVEAGRRIVPLSDLDWTGFVSYIDDVEAIRPTIGIVVVRYWVELAVGKLMVHQHPVVVGSDFDVYHPSNLCVVC